MSRPLLPISIEKFIGLRPEAWICVGPGFAREEIKDALLSSGHAITGSVVTTVQELALKILRASGASFKTDELLRSSARQEALRLLLSEPRILARVPEIRRLRRQTTFFRRLDQALQAGRTAFSHDEEEQVFDGVLKQRFGSSVLRDEIRQIAGAYEAWLEGSRLLDPPRLLRLACQALETGNAREFPFPAEIDHVTARTTEGLERKFWEEIGKFTHVRRLGPGDFRPRETADRKVHWEIWHTLDDAAEALAETFARDGTFAEDVVLIPDSASVRRTLKRAFTSLNIPLADPRDPNRPRWEEGIKWALLPLEVVGRNFERQNVISLILSGGFPVSAKARKEWIDEIQARGIRDRLKSYSGGKLTELDQRLLGLSKRLGGKKTCEEMAQAHLSELQSMLSACQDPEASQGLFWLPEFFETLWKDFVSDLRRINQEERLAPPLYWLERLENRLLEAASPVEKIRPEQGIQVYRFHQASPRPAKRAWLFGLPPNWLSGESTGDYWFSERDREALSSEFGVRSSIQVRQERLQALSAWLQGVSEIRVMGARYEENGAESEDLFPLLSEIGREAGIQPPEEPEEKGAHPRWRASFGALRPVPPREIQLPPASNVMNATALDRYSRCGFQGLAYTRWKLWDVKEPDTELWPEVRGNILHEAVRLMLEEKLPPSEALEGAWRAKPPRGLIRGPKIERYVRSRLLEVLRLFEEKEREFSEKTQTSTLSLEEKTFEYAGEGFVIRGTPDRIDETPDGLFIIDYKTSSDLPNGTEMLEQGYRLQLPFYALAAKREYGKSVVGCQLVELTRKGSRGSGVFFKRFNGKERGKLTNLRSNSKSLFSIEPDEAWSKLEDHVATHARGYIGGEFSVKPKRGEKECRSCAVSDLCGTRRSLERSGDGGEEGGE